MLYPYNSQWYRPNKKDQFEYISADKGKFKGSCNRSACQAPGMAWWYHQDNSAYYCFECAALINMYQTEADLKRLRYNDTRTLIIPLTSEFHPHHQEVPEWGREAQGAFDTLCLNRRQREFVKDCMILFHTEGGEIAQLELISMLQDVSPADRTVFMYNGKCNLNDVTKLVGYLVSVASVKPT